MSRTYKTRTVDDITWAPGLTVEGKVQEVGSMKVGNEDRRFMVIDDGQRLNRVWYAEGLADAFKGATKGDGISITAAATKQTHRGRTFRPFSVQLWTETPDAADGRG